MKSSLSVNFSSVHELWIPYALIMNGETLNQYDIALHKFKFGNNTKPVAH